MENWASVLSATEENAYLLHIMDRSYLTLSSRVKNDDYAPVRALILKSLEWMFDFSTSTESDLKSVQNPTFINSYGVLTKDYGNKYNVRADRWVI